MPLVERYNDWVIHDQSYDDPQTLAFDHRVDADASDLKKAEASGALVGVENNLRATCIITQLDPSYGWVDAGAGEWIYDPAAPAVQTRPTLGDHFNRNLTMCIHKDQRDMLGVLTSNPDPAVNITDSNVMETLRTMTWPADGNDSRPKTSFVTRFPLADQCIAGLEWSSGYHLGNGLVATAGHCLLSSLSESKLPTLKVVFGWSANVRGKRFGISKVFEIEKVMLIDHPGEYADATDLGNIGDWARRWDNAVLKLKGTPELFQDLGRVRLAGRPPRFGCPVYNAGYPLGTPLKVSWKSHVLRHAIFNGKASPFSHTIGPQGTYSTDLDQFPGNSGGPVFDASTGEVVGHTVSTQSAVAEATIGDIEKWETEFLSSSKNFADALEIINPHLTQKKHSDPSYRVHPKFCRTLSGKPNGGALFLNTTFVCPDDIAPNRTLQPPNTYCAVFNRHKWNSPDVVHRNLTGRIDRVYLFTRPLASTVREIAGSVLVIRLAGPSDAFKEPRPDSKFIIRGGESQFEFSFEGLAHESTTSSSLVVHSFTVDLSTEAKNGRIPLVGHNASSTLANWTHVRLEQPADNQPNSTGLELTFHRAAFTFPVDKRWPSNRPDITDDVADRNLEWPAEEFRFATTVGANPGHIQRDEVQASTPTVSGGRAFVWTAPIDRIWTNPDQPVAIPETTYS